VVTNLAFGNMEGIQAITSALPAEDKLARLIMVMMVCMIIFTYPIFIYPCNLNLEKYTIDKFMKGQNKSLIYWMKNISRIAVCAITSYISIELS